MNQTSSTFDLRATDRCAVNHVVSELINMTGDGLKSVLCDASRRAP